MFLPWSFWWTTPEYRWWMRWRKPIYGGAREGCMDNSHDFESDDEGCPCNQFNKLTKKWIAKGYYLVASGRDWFFLGGRCFHLYSDGKTTLRIDQFHGR